MKLFLRVTAVYLLVACTTAGFAQVTADDCPDAVNICTNASFSVTPNGFGQINELPSGSTVNPSTNPASGNFGCLLAGELNSTWMIVNIASTGVLQFSFGSPGSGGCFDWIMWPYNSTTCTQIQNNTIPPIRCNWNSPCDGFTGIANPLPAGGFAGNFEPPLNVICGEQYLICLSNYSSLTTNVPLNFFGSAQVSCSTFVPITATGTTICQNNCGVLTASGGNSYTWSPATALSATTGASVTACPTVTTTYTVSGTGNCGSGTATATVIVSSSSLTVTVSPQNPSYCSPGSVTLNASGANTYTWSPANSLSATTGASVSANPSSTTTYTIVGTDAQGCTGSTTVTVTIGTPPSLTTSSTPVLCSTSNSGSASVTASGGNAPYTYLWSPSLQTGSTATGLNGGTYTVTVTDAAGCSSTSTITVASTSGLTASVPTSANVSCFNSCNGSASAQPTGGTAPYTYLWSNGATTQNVSSLCAGTYTVTITDANNCSGTTTITITQPAALSVSSSNAVSICSGGSTTISTLVNGGTSPYNYQWSSGATTSTISVSPTSTTTFVLIVTDANGCLDSASTTITVNPSPVVAFSAGPLNGCVPLCVTFTNSTPNSTSCLWDFGNSATSPNCNPSYCYNTPGVYSVTLTVTDNNGCTNSQTVPNMISAYPVPAAGFTVSTDSASILDPFITVTNTCQGCDSAYYTISDGNNVITAGSGSSFTHQFGDTGTYTITQLVITLQGCTATYTTVVVIHPEFTLFVPNAFTPNGDGPNDVFLPLGTGIDLDNYDLWIYDRWGNMIFHTSTWGQGWDGRANGGKSVVQEDVYVWKIVTRDFASKKRQYVGHVTVVK